MGKDGRHNGSIAGEIIGSFIAGIVIATIIILLTGKFNILTCSIFVLRVTDFIQENLIKPDAHCLAGTHMVS